MLRGVVDGAHGRRVRPAGGDDVVAAGHPLRPQVVHAPALDGAVVGHGLGDVSEHAGARFRGELVQVLRNPRSAVEAPSE